MTDFTRRILNLLHFHRKQAMVASGFIGCTSIIGYKSLELENEILRMGVAGSIANIISESAFHAVDTVNIRAKASNKHVSTLSVVNKIW